MLLTASTWNVALLITLMRLGVDASLLSQTSPAWLSTIPTPAPGSVSTSFPKDEMIKEAPLDDAEATLDKNQYPTPLQLAEANHPEVKEVIKQIDWSKVPSIKPRKVINYELDVKSYDTQNDPDCWWSSSNCKKPKLDYLPEDIHMCPNAGDWGLNYDDGPYKVWYPQSADDKQWEEPRFYNYLVKQNKQKATLFFVGSNVMGFPAAARRALNDGHTICSHTWSHRQMTSLTNEQIVAELYWTHRAIKEATGVTPKCWRPPYGDVDDRVRSIAWQMGMRTILWDQDSNDWDMIGTPANGKLTPDVVDGYFQKWVDARKSNQDNTNGHITLEHENSNVTVAMAEKWLPKLQEHFKVMSIHSCVNDAHPYWEENWVYPTRDGTNKQGNGNKNEAKVGNRPNSSASSLLPWIYSMATAMFLGFLPMLVNSI